MEINPTASGVALPAGTYWIMGIFDVTASIGFSTAAGANVVSYVSLPFGAPLPSRFPAPTTYTGQTFNYYLVVM
jgi:hypothetical protein